MKIDISHFKKVDTDHKSTVLQHPSGHQIKVAHNGLSSEMKKELDSLPMHLAKGGKAKFAQKFDPNMKASKPSKSSNTMPGSPTEAKDAYTEPNEMGTKMPPALLKEELKQSGTTPDVVLGALHREAPPFGPMGSPKYHAPPCINPSCKSFGQSHPNCRCYGGKMGMYGGYAKGGEVENFCSEDRKHEEGCEYYADGGGPVGKDFEMSPDFLKNMENTETITVPKEVADKYRNMMGGDSKNKQEIAKAENSVPSQQQSMANLYNLGNNKVPEAQQQMQPAATEDTSSNVVPVAHQEAGQNYEQPQQEAMPVEPQQIDPVQKVQQDKNNLNNIMHKESNMFESELNSGKITPKTYKDLFHDKNLPEKIGTLFGLLVGGAGAGLSHQPNMLMQMMDNQIQNDLKAQETSSSNKQNFLRINGQNLTNLANAGHTGAETNQMKFALATDMANMANFHNLVEYTNKLPPGPLKAQAEQKLALLYQSIKDKRVGMFDQAASAGALANQLGGQNTTMMKSGLLGPEFREVGQDIESKRIPGIPGLASQPIPQANRDELQAMNVLDNKAKDILSFAKAHKGTLSPSQRAIGEQKAEEMVNFYNSSIKGGVLTEGRLKWLDDQIKKNPTSIFQDILGNNSRLQEIQNSNSTRRNIMLNSLGLKGYPQSKQSMPQEIKTMNGVQYQKVNGGWQRVR